MQNLIGYSLDFVLNKITNKGIKIVYNTDDNYYSKSLYVTNIIENDNIIYITVSSFKIEV